MAGIGAIFTYEAQLFLGMRNPDYSNNKGCKRELEYAGGKIEINKDTLERETPMEACVREVSEEFAITFSNPEILYNADNLVISYDKNLNVNNGLYISELCWDDVRRISSVSRCLVDKIQAGENVPISEIIVLGRNCFITDFLAQIDKKTMHFDCYSQGLPEPQVPLRNFNRFLIKAAIDQGKLTKLVWTLWKDK